MHEEDFTESTSRPSKTKQKEAMHELRGLGEELVDLPLSQLKRLGLPEDLYAAVRECQKITAHGAKRRQVMYLGKLMRTADDEPIRAGLALLRGENTAENARLQRLERMRVRLLADETMLTEIANTWPGADITHLRQLRRNALKEQEANKPPKNFRAIYQVLKELDDQLQKTKAEEADE
jgi:ribosome-associated protein